MTWDHSGWCTIDLIHKLKEGDEGSWDLFFFNYSVDVFRIARSHGLTDCDSEDILQNTFCTVYKRIGEFQTIDEPLKFLHYVNVIIANHINNLNRKAYRNGETSDLGENTMVDQTNSIHGHELEASHIQNEEINNALQALPERDRQIYVERHAFDEKPRMLAKRYGIKPPSISKSLQRSKKTINSKNG